MSEQSRRFKANLAGKEYTIIGSASLGHLRAVTRMVNEQFSQIQLIASNMSKEDQAMLLVFNAISDQLTKEEELEAMRSDQKKTLNKIYGPTQTTATSPLSNSQEIINSESDSLGNQS